MAGEAASFEVGDLVAFQKLQKTPEYNGKLGVVKELKAGSDGRWTVRVFEFDKLLNVKQDNLRTATKEELSDQLSAAFDKLRADQIETILHNNDVKVDSSASKQELIAAAVSAKLIPEVVKKKQDLDEEFEVPGSGRMTRREMLERARALENLSMTQIREQLRMLTSHSPQDLRNKSPQMRNMTDEQIQAQIQQLRAFTQNPRLKKAQVEALKTGDFSKLEKEMAAGMSDSELRENIRQQLELFRKDPAAFRQQYFRDRETLSDKDIEEMLEAQLNLDPAQLRAMASGRAKPEDMDFSNMSDEQLKKQTEMQIKLFKSDPKKFRALAEQQNPEMKNLSDDQILMQLETMASMSKKDLEEMTKIAKNGGLGAGGSTGSMPTPNMDNMSGEQIKSLFKTQLDMFRRDPKAFRRAVPQMAGMKDEDIVSQLQMMADMDPSMIKMFISFQSYAGKFKEPIDRLTGGRGQQVIGVIMMLMVAILVYILFAIIYRLLAFVFPTTFGFGMQQAATSQAAAGVKTGVDVMQAGVQQVDINVEDDAFFQENEDL